MASSNITNTTIHCHGLRFVEYQFSHLIYQNVLPSLALNVVIATLAVVANSVFILIIWKKRNLQTAANVLFTPLAVTDVLVGLCPVPMSAAFRFYQTKGIHLCGFGIAWAFSGYLLCVWSTMVICIISIDRYVATFQLQTYRTRAYHRKKLISLFLAWSFWLVFLIFPFTRILGFVVLNAAVFAFLIVVLSTVVFCYARIVCKLRSSAVSLRNFTSNITTRDAHKQFNDACTKRRCTTAGILVFAFVLAYLPRFAVTLVFFFEKKKQFDIVYLSGLWSETFIYLNSAVNPVLYLWRLRDVRLAFLQVLGGSRPVKPWHNIGFEMEMKKVDKMTERRR